LRIIRANTSTCYMIYEPFVFSGYLYIMIIGVRIGQVDDYVASCTLFAPVILLVVFTE